MHGEERRRIPERVIRAVRLLLEHLEEKGVRIEAAYIFGSYARGDYLDTSDVDLVIVSPSWRGLRWIERLDLVYRIEWKLRLSPWIEVLPLAPEELEERLERSVVLRDARRYWVRIV